MVISIRHLFRLHVLPNMGHFEPHCENKGYGDPVFGPAASTCYYVNIICKHSAAIQDESC